MKTKYTFKTLLIDLLFDFMGCSLYGIAMNCFILPSGIATGGISGVSLIINYLTGIPIGVCTILLNIPIILFCYKVLGKVFLLKSIKTMTVLSICIDTITKNFPKYEGDIILAAVCTGVLVGAGLSCTFMRGSSTGGADFVTLSVRKLYPHFSIGTLCLIFDYTVLTAGGFVFKNINATLYGAIAMFIASQVMDKIVYGSSRGKLMFVVTEKGEEVAQSISSAVHRGSSIADIRGGYKGEKKQLVISAVSKQELFKARKIVHESDESSFIMVTSTEKVFGEGFTDPRED